MLKTVDIMQDEAVPITGRNASKGAFNGYAVNNSKLRQIISAKTASDMFLRDACHHVIERNDRQRMLAQAHQHDIDGHPVQPRGENRFPTKGRELSVQLKKGFLSEVFGQRKIVHHAYAYGINALLVHPVELREGVGLAVLGLGQDSVCMAFGWNCVGFAPRARNASRVEQRNGKSCGNHVPPNLLGGFAKQCFSNCAIPISWRLSRIAHRLSIFFPACSHRRHSKSDRTG